MSPGASRRALGTQVARRMAWVSAASGAVSLSVMLAALLLAGVGVMANNGQLVADLVSAASRDRCEADPERWSVVVPGKARAFAYDAATGRSANPDAPPLDDALRRQLAHREMSTHPRIVAGEPTMEMIYVTGGAGPCGALRLSWTVQSTNQLRIASAVLIAVVVASLITTGFTLTRAIRPFVSRMEALREAATRLGSGRWSPLPEVPDDPFDPLARVLTAAHARVMDDRAVVIRQQRALEDHIETIAHDVRTPLAALQLRLEAAADHDPALGAALGDVAYLGLLLENLRLATVLTPGHVPDDVTSDLGEAVGRVAARMAILERRRGVEVAAAIPDAPVPVRVAPAEAQQFVANLVHNAVVYLGGPGHVGVVLDRDGDTFVLEVVDDGPGVDPALLSRVVERGARGLDAADLHPEGQGLGLSICARIARERGWTLTFAREEPHGLRVTVRGNVGPQPAP